MSKSTDLTRQFGRGFSVDNLERARNFYLTFASAKKSATALRKSIGGEMIEWLCDIAARFPLPLLHYRTLLRVGKPEARSFYKIGVVHSSNEWSCP